jgi:chemotaxis protein MotA
VDLGTIGGIIFATLLILMVGVGPANLLLFVDSPSAGIVIGGTLGAIFVAYPPSLVKHLPSILKNAFVPQINDTVATIKLVVSFAEQARREGILSLEARTEEITDEFLKKGIQLAVDGTEPELIKDILNTEVEFIDDRHKVNIDLVENIAAICPAFGMIGTLVGLVLMLANMSDPANIGPAMAVALITTLYGAVVANLFFTPFALKLKKYSDEELAIKNMMLEGIMSLQSGDNPRIVELKLTAFIEPAKRLEFAEANADV